MHAESRKYIQCMYIYSIISILYLITILHVNIIITCTISVIHTVLELITATPCKLLTAKTMSNNHFTTQVTNIKCLEMQTLFSLVEK